MGDFKTVNKLFIKLFLVISIYRTRVVFLADKLANAIWDLTAWQHSSSATIINKWGNIFSSFSSQQICGEGSREKKGSFLNSGSRNVRSTHPPPTGVSNRRIGQNFKKKKKKVLNISIVEVKRQVTKRCLVSEWLSLSPGRIPFSVTHLHSSLQHLISSPTIWKTLKRVGKGTFQCQDVHACVSHL